MLIKFKVDIVYITIVPKLFVSFSFLTMLQFNHLHYHDNAYISFEGPFLFLNYHYFGAFPIN